MNTIIGKDTVFTGTLDVKGALRIDGKIKGKVISNDCVTIGSTGMVEADIEADTAVVAGRLVGNINTSNKIELQANCDVEGDLKTGSLVIEQGAVFCGACNMKEGGKANLDFLEEMRRSKRIQSKQAKFGVIANRKSGSSREARPV